MKNGYFSDGLYNVLKFVAQVFLPGLGTLYVALAALWGLPAAEAVGGTILAIDTFLGGLLHLSTSAYANSEDRFSGAINVSQTADKKTFSLDLKDHPEELEGKDEVTFKVNKPGTY